MRWELSFFYYARKGSYWLCVYRYHLQAFRHLYVLAAESRLLLPRDIDNKALVYANINMHFIDTKYYRNQQVKLMAPCLLPELKYLKKVSKSYYISCIRVRIYTLIFWVTLFRLKSKTIDIGQWYLSAKRIGISWSTYIFGKKYGGQVCPWKSGKSWFFQKINIL